MTGSGSKGSASSMGLSGSSSGFSTGGALGMSPLRSTPNDGCSKGWG